MEKAATKSKAEKIRDWAQFVILLGAGVWAAATFYIKEIYIPANRPASLVVTGSLEEVGRKGEFALIRARVHLINKQEVKIYAPALWFTVRGLQFQATPYKSCNPKLQNEDGSLIQTFANYSNLEKTVVANWQSGDWRNWYEKDNEATYEELFYVPHDKYQALQLDVEHWVTRSITDIAAVGWNLKKDGSFSPLIEMKKIGYENDLKLTEAYDQKNPRHEKSLIGLGQDSHISTLSFLPVISEERKLEK